MCSATTGQMAAGVVHDVTNLLTVVLGHAALLAATMPEDDLGREDLEVISRAAQHPPVLYLTVAIVAVRTFGIARGVCRYAERLTGHDAAFRVLAELRVATYRRLAALSPAGLPGLRAGDLVSRFVADVDAGLDVLVRVVQPYLVAAVVGAGSVALVAALLPAAGTVLAAGLLLVRAGVSLTVLHVLSAQERTAPAGVAALRDLESGEERALGPAEEIGARVEAWVERLRAAAGRAGAEWVDVDAGVPPAQTLRKWLRG